MTGGIVGLYVFINTFTMLGQTKILTDIIKRHHAFSMTRQHKYLKPCMHIWHVNTSETL